MRKFEGERNSIEPNDEKMFVVGMSVKGARINLDSSFLEDEREGEFEQVLPVLEIFLTAKSKTRAEVFFKEVDRSLFVISCIELIITFEIY